MVGTVVVGGDGAVGVVVETSAKVTNTATAIGGNGGDAVNPYGSGGAGGDGIVFQDGGTLVNHRMEARWLVKGIISAGNIFLSAVVQFGGAFGVSFLAGGSLTNCGTVTGGKFSGAGVQIVGVGTSRNADVIAGGAVPVSLGFYYDAQPALQVWC